MTDAQILKTRAAIETARANLSAAEQRRAEVLAEIETLTAQKAALPFSEAKIAEHFAKMRAAHDKRDIAEQMIESAKAALAAAEANANEQSWRSRHDQLKFRGEELAKIIRTDFANAVAALVAILAQVRDYNEEFAAFTRESLRQGRAGQSAVESPLALTQFRDFDKIYIAGPNNELLWPAESAARIAAREAKEAFQREETRRADAARNAAIAKRDSDYEGSRTWVP